MISYSDPAVYFVGVDFIHAGVEGQGRFTEVVKQVALNLDGWGIDCTFADYNNGGFLDLYVCSYLDYGKVLSGADNFFPYDFTGQNNVLYFNRGDDRFIDVTKSIGISGGNHLILGVAGAD